MLENFLLSKNIMINALSMQSKPNELFIIEADLWINILTRQA